MCCCTDKIVWYELVTLKLLLSPLNLQARFNVKIPADTAVVQCYPESWKKHIRHVIMMHLLNCFIFTILMI